MEYVVSLRIKPLGSKHVEDNIIKHNGDDEPYDNRIKY